MKENLPDFTLAAAPPLSVQALIALAKTSADPAEIDAALLAHSKNPPFWPEGGELTAFYIQSKFDAALDAKLLAAAALSAPARALSLLGNRVSDKQGAFTHFICPVPENPLQSRIFKVVRAPHIGAGTGAWGGLKEGEDVDVRVTVNREVFEEVIDAVKLLLKLEGGKDATALEQRFDACLHDAGARNRPLAEGVRNFISGLDGSPVLQARVRDFTDRAASLIDDLIAADKKKMFQCRDDGHAINRGWGFRVDAFAYVAVLSPATADKFDLFNQSIRALQEAAIQKGFSTVAGEMQGLAVYTLAEAPEQVKKIFYGHEGLAEIAGFALLLGPQAPGNLWDSFSHSGAVDILAGKMRLTPARLRETYDALLADGGAGYVAIAPEAYAAAAKQPSPSDALKARV